MLRLSKGNESCTFGLLSVSNIAIGSTLLKELAAKRFSMPETIVSFPRVQCCD